MAVVLGLDPGSRKTGFALLDVKGGKVRHLRHGTIKLSDKLTVAERLAQLHDGLKCIFEEVQIDHVAVESMFLGKSATSAFKLGQARGICLLMAGQVQAKVYEYAPRRVKRMITGSGNAEKEQVRLLSLRHLSLSSNEGDDATDALALALCHVFENKFMFSNNAAGECEL